MVVQCPTCQSKFRIADDKVTDRGVRVRCTSCKAVFQVKKPGAAASEQAPGPGSTMDLSSLGAAAVARSPARSAAPGSRAAPSASRPPPAASRPPPARPAASRPPAAVRTNGAARRLEADDLFGMSELTGDAPLGEAARSKPPPPPPAAAKTPGVSKPIPNFDDIDIEVDDAPAPPPSRPPPPRTSRPPPPPKAAAEPPPPPPEDSALDAEPAKPPPPPPAGEDTDAATLGAFKSGPLKDPFEGMNLGEPGTGAIELATEKKDKLTDAAIAEATAKTAPLPPPIPEVPPGREMVSSALTGLVGAALAVAVVVVAAISDDASAGWLGFSPRTDVVATHVASGLYDTASGKPVFYIRGRVENRGKKVRGPVRVTAELISDGTAEAKAESIAGMEPTPEEVWSLRTSADVDKLNRQLEGASAERKIQPGGSVPFFAVIPDPPPDLQRHRLHVKVESVDAWVPPAPTPRKGK